MINSGSQRELRRKSMYGTVLLLAAVLVAIAAIVRGALWLAVVGVLLLVPAVVTLYRVGKSLP